MTFIFLTMDSQYCFLSKEEYYPKHFLKIKLESLTIMFEYLLKAHTTVSFPSKPYSFGKKKFHYHFISTMPSSPILHLPYLPTPKSN